MLVANYLMQMFIAYSTENYKMISENSEHKIREYGVFCETSQNKDKI